MTSSLNLQHTLDTPLSFLSFTDHIILLLLQANDRQLTFIVAFYEAPIQLWQVYSSLTRIVRLVGLLYGFFDLKAILVVGFW